MWAPALTRLYAVVEVLVIAWLYMPRDVAGFTITTMTCEPSNAADSRQTRSVWFADGREPLIANVRKNQMGTIPTLETERLLLRPFCQSDAAEVTRLAGDRSVAATTSNIPHPYNESMACEWIERHQPTFEKDEGVAFAITLKADGSLVGAISLMGMVKGHRAELGYWIGKPYWGLGYCTEAAREVLEYAFGVLRLSRVHASHFARNPASGRVMQKVGMRSEGCCRQHIQKWGQLEDLEIYGILEQEWRDIANQAMQRTRDKIGPDGKSEVASR